MSHGGDIYRNKVDIDFSVNLNPLGIRPEMKEALARSLDRSEEYPDPDQALVREKIAAVSNRTPACFTEDKGTESRNAASFENIVR